MNPRWINRVAVAGLIGPSVLLWTSAYGQAEPNILAPNRIHEANDAWPSVRPGPMRLPTVGDRQNGNSLSPMREGPPRFPYSGENRSMHFAGYLQDAQGNEEVRDNGQVEFWSAKGAFEALEEDIEAQDDRLMELEEKVGQRGVVHAMNALSFDLGGFVSQTFTSIPSDDNFQSSFDLSQFELFLAGEVTEKLTYFTILEFKRQAKVDETDLNSVVFKPITKEAELELAWFNYRHDDWRQIRVGRFITPHGIINVEHFHPTLLHIPYPMFMRQGKTSTFFHRFLIGTQVHGSRYVGPREADRLEYHAYVGTQKETGSKFILGARVNYTFGESGLTVGLNYGHGTHESGALASRYNFGGIDLLYDHGCILWKNEFYGSAEEDADDRLGFYTQPGWRVRENVIVFYRFDYLDPGRNLEDQTEHVLGINYLPIPLIRLRAAITLAEFHNRPDHQLMQLSTTISF